MGVAIFLVSGIRVAAVETQNSISLRVSWNFKLVIERKRGKEHVCVCVCVKRVATAETGQGNPPAECVPLGENSIQDSAGGVTRVKRKREERRAYHHV